MLSRQLWLIAGFAALACGVAGAVLPLVPSTPFVLLAAFAFARSSPRLHRWLLDHPRFGPPVEDWCRYGSIAPRLKVMAVIAMIATLLLTLAVGAAWWVVALQAATLACVALFILSRPGGPRSLERPD